MEVQSSGFQFAWNQNSLLERCQRRKPGPGLVDEDAAVLEKS